MWTVGRVNGICPHWTVSAKRTASCGAVVDELSTAAQAIRDAREADDTPRLAERLRPLPGSWPGPGRRTGTGGR